MSNRDRHVGKTPQQRQAYGRYIQNLDYEPTTDEQIDFGSTEKGGEELSQSLANRRSRGYTQNKIREHFKDHWIEWIIAGIVIFGLFLINESRLTTSLISNTLNNTTEKVDFLTSDVKSMDDKIDQLEMQSIINSKDIEILKEKK